MPALPESSAADSSARRNRLAGLDALRIVALILVTWQHAASVLGFYADTQWRGISPGQAGVAIFCAISGFLAFRAAPDHPGEWFRKRLLSVFPAYWLVTIAAFAMVLVAGSDKPVGLGLFVSQMLGLGYFTHGWELVNVVSWFLSLILLCYVLGTIAWTSRRPGLFWSAVILVALVLVLSRAEVVLSRHVIAFALGACYGLPVSRAPLTIIAAILLVYGVSVDPQLFYAGLALLAIGLAVASGRRENKAITVLAGYSYEYFLVHGICLVAAHKWIANSVLTVVSALVAAALSAIVLQRLMKPLGAAIVSSRLFERPTLR